MSKEYFEEHFDFLRIAGCVPRIHPADPNYNADKIIAMIQVAEEEKVGLAVFPRLSLTGLTCGDLFFQRHLYEEQMTALEKIIVATEGLSVTVLVGFYVSHRGCLFDTLAVIRDGAAKRILTPPPAEELQRWFSSVNPYEQSLSVTLGEEEIEVFGDFFSDGQLNIGFSPDCDIILNLGTHSQLVDTADFQRSLAISESGRYRCGYISLAPGIGESTASQVYGGHCILAENGEILADSPIFSREDAMTISEIDWGKIHHLKPHATKPVALDSFDYSSADMVPLSCVEEGILFRKYSQTPFVPEDYNKVCSEIFRIQAHGLARRLETAHSKKTVIGISGGLDSTLAVLVCHEAHKILGKPFRDIVTVTMPGFGTTDHTYDNAIALMRHLNTDLREVSIAEAVRLHFKDIGHDGTTHDVTYENSQARERTQILMDIANMEGGLVVGTGDLSEAALGWCTYNGDHMSMYSVNGNVPKTLVRVLVRWYAENTEDTDLSETLLSIVDTPISPELLPPDKEGDIAQKTEDKVGPYVLHDFFLYHTVRSGWSPKKLLFVGEQTFAEKYDKAFISRWQKTFYNRFFAQQFKRNCYPDGPRVGSLSLSPHGQWIMPSDGSAQIWIK